MTEIKLERRTAEEIAMLAAQYKVERDALERDLAAAREKIGELELLLMQANANTEREAGVSDACVVQVRTMRARIAELEGALEETAARAEKECVPVDTADHWAIVVRDMSLNARAVLTKKGGE